MELTVAETIKENTRRHLEESDGLLFGQCVTAVGWIGGTVPDCKNVVEIPMTDVAAPGFAVGAALMGKRPIFVVRYQGFMWYNSSSLVNYAAKSKEIWSVPCPVFIRAIAMEGGGVGHTASSCAHSLFMHAPGMPVAAPMTPGEWQTVWDYFLQHDDPVYCSEHRRSFTLTHEMPNEILTGPADVTIVAISAARLNALEAAAELRLAGLRVNLIHQLWLKPFQASAELQTCLQNSRMSVVIDSDFEIAGASRSIAYELGHMIGRPVYALGIQDRSCGAAPRVENITPKKQAIVEFVMEGLRKL
jgi:pyruvate/2-oxoglutarate/acetoin dehydrogenase E1 component